MPGEWRYTECAGGPGGVRGNLGEKSDFGSVSFVSGLSAGYPREASPLLPAFSFLPLHLQNQRSNILPGTVASHLVCWLGFLQPLTLRQERSQQRSPLGAAGQALNTAGPVRCSTTDNPRSTARQHLFTERQQHKLSGLEGTLEVIHCSCMVGIFRLF